jgi:nitroimidazol reductase NimA-like FMN-containing flavoprotein (pyridoxamine 5'-phosphate oxidase superfamily)
MYYNEMENAMSSPTPGPRTTLRRLPERARYERAAIHAILDEALWCHVGFVQDGQPFVIPTIHARVAERLYVHGSAASRMLRTLAGGIPACVTVSLLDGLVLARSAFHHSMNYRSVVLLGSALPVEDPAEKQAALRAIVEHVCPGRSQDVRGPSETELRATSVLRLPIEEASAKLRSGPPLDDEADYGLPCWAGVLPLRLSPGPPEADPRLAAGVPLPGYVSAYRRP